MGRHSEYTNTLTERELETLKLVCDGYTNLEIANSLFVSVKTIEHYLHSIYNKLDIHETRKLICTAYKMGLVTPPLINPDNLYEKATLLLNELKATIDLINNGESKR